MPQDPQKQTLLELHWHWPMASTRPQAKATQLPLVKPKYPPTTPQQSLPVLAKLQVSVRLLYLLRQMLPAMAKAERKVFLPVPVSQTLRVPQLYPALLRRYYYLHPPEPETPAPQMKMRADSQTETM